MNRRLRALSAPLRLGYPLLVRLLAVCLAAAATAIAALAVSAVPAWATHFRAAELSWSRPSATSSTVTFAMTESFRRNYAVWTNYAPTGGGTAEQPNVGDVVRDANSRLFFGDGGSTN